MRNVGAFVASLVLSAAIVLAWDAQSKFFAQSGKSLLAVGAPLSGSIRTIGVDP